MFDLKWKHLTSDQKFRRVFLSARMVALPINANYVICILTIAKEKLLSALSWFVSLQLISSADRPSKEATNHVPIRMTRGQSLITALDGNKCLQNFAVQSRLRRMTSIYERYFQITRRSVWEVRSSSEVWPVCVVCVWTSPREDLHLHFNWPWSKNVCILSFIRIVVGECVRFCVCITD